MNDIFSWVYTESGILGLIVGAMSVSLAMYIATGQNKQMASLEELTKEQKQQIQNLEALNKNIDEHVLGTLGGFDRVLESIIKLLEEANLDKNSTVYFMAYWLWFGADKEFEKGLSKITRHESDFFLKLRGRVAQNKLTTVVVYNDRETITNFVKTLVGYKKATTSEPVPLDDASITSLVTAYMEEIEWITAEALKNDNVTAKFRPEIPAIIFAVEGEASAGIWYIGETAMLDQKSQLGGFKSRNPAMVGMLIDQVKHFAEQANA